MAREVGAGSVDITARFIGHALRQIGENTVCSTCRGRRDVGSAVDVIVGVAGDSDRFRGFASDGVGECFVRVLNQSGGAVVGGAGAVVGVAPDGGADGVGVGDGVSSVAGEG